MPRFFPMKPKIKTRIGTRAESLPFAGEIAALSYPNAKQDAKDLTLADGNRDAIRVQFDRETGEALRDKTGGVRICAPWLLCDVFAG